MAVSNSGLRRLMWLAALMPLVFAATACSNAATAPSGGTKAGAALSGTMRNILQGKVGGGGITINLHESSGVTCDTQTPPLQTTVSKEDGSYQFDGPVQPLNYCIEYGGRTFSCTCDWSTGTCTCSPPAGQ